MHRRSAQRRRHARTVTFITAVVALLAGASLAFAAASDLDPAFGTGGTVSQPVGWGDSHAYATALQPDGKVIAAGESDDGYGYKIVVVTRFNANGSLDSSFDGDGATYKHFFGSSDDVARAAAVQSDGKILVAGESDNAGTRYFAATRLNSDGSPDTSFGTAGAATIYMNGVASAMAIQPDHKIVLAGSAFNGINHDFGVVRLNPDGSLDTSFDGDGKFTSAIGLGGDFASGVVVQPDGKIVVVGKTHNGSNNDFALLRINANGSLDNSFDFNAISLTGFGSGNDEPTDVAIQSDGKLVVSGFSNNGTNDDFALARFNTDGSLDTSFSGDGRLTTTFGGWEDIANGVAIQADGRILAAGGASNGANDDFAIARYLPDGSLDTAFGGDGTVLTPIGTGNDYGYDVAIAANGRIFMAGDSSALFKNFAMASYVGDPPPSASSGAPTASITSPSKGRLSRKKLKRFAGTAGPAGKVAKVEIALHKIDKRLLKQKRCLWLKNDRAAFRKVKARKGKCSSPRFLKARGTTTWSFPLKRNLAKGTYELFVRVTLVDGRRNTTFKAAQGNYRKFSLR